MKLEPEVKAKFLRHGATSSSSGPLCSWPPAITPDECAGCSIGTCKGHAAHVTVQAERYSSFDPDRWWETRTGIRTEIIEFEKLVLDVVLHPFSF